MPHTRWDHDEAGAGVSDVVFQEQAPRGAALARIIQNNLQMPLVYEEAVSLLSVTAPRSDRSGKKPRLVGLNDRHSCRVPFRSIYFRDDAVVARYVQDLPDMYPVEGSPLELPVLVG
jgi:hypothetical protein